MGCTPTGPNLNNNWQHEKGLPNSNASPFLRSCLQFVVNSFAHILEFDITKHLSNTNVFSFSYFANSVFRNLLVLQWH